MTSVYTPFLVSKLERAIAELSEQAEPKGAVQRSKIVGFFQSIITEYQDETLAYDARMLAQIASH